jgi:ElaB/YqjD/DUF883 family membrane-anchored ribosome-binding protein
MTAAKHLGAGSVRDPEIARAEAELARTRDTVARSVAALQRELSRTLDWREWVQRKPLLSVALVFGAGALLGLWVHRRKPE